MQTKTYILKAWLLIVLLFSVLFHHFSTVSCCDQLVVGPTHASGLTSWWLMVLLDDSSNAVVYFQPPSLLIEKVWVLVMHVCACPIHCRVHWREGRGQGSCRLIPVQPLIGSTIWAFSICSTLWVLDVLSCLCWHSFYQSNHNTLWWMFVRVNWLMLYQECRREVFWARYCSFCTLRSFFPFLKIIWSVMLMTPLWWLMCNPQTSDLQLQSPWSMTLAGLVSGVTFGGSNWMRVRPWPW